MDAQTLIPWLIVAAIAIVGAVVIWRGLKLSRTTVVDAGAPAQAGPLLVHGEIVALGEAVAAPLSGTSVVYAEAFAEVTRHEPSSSGSGTTKRTDTRSLGKITSRFLLRTPTGDTEVDGNDIRSLSGISKVAVARPQDGGQATALLQSVATTLGAGREDLFERRLTPGDRVWMRGDALEQIDTTVRLTGRLRAYGRPVTQSARTMLMVGALILVGAVVAAIVVAVV